MKNKKNEVIYLVRCYSLNLKSFDDRIIRERTWGFYKSLRTARKCVKENWTDLFEAGYYNYAVIMKMPQGICVHPELVEWYDIKYGAHSQEYVISKIDFDPINLSRNEEKRFKYFISW